MSFARGVRTIAIVSVFALGPRALSQQAPLSFQGVVFEAGSDTPIAKATVELRSDSGATTLVASTRTDSAGKFYLPAVAPGSYRLVASHAGHVLAEYGQRQMSGPGTRVDPANPPSNIRIAMTKAGVISGRTLERGQPIGNSDALLVKAFYTEGQLSFTPVLAIRTDDLGEFHLFWIPPGRYYLIGVVWDIANSVPRYVNPTGTDENAISMQHYIGRANFLRSMAGGVLDNQAHIPMYYPGTPDPKLAIPIEVQPGAQLRGMDIDVTSVPIRRVLGKVDGIPAPNAAQPGTSRGTVSMRPLLASLSTSAAQAPGTATDASGNFEIAAVAPGRYLVTASAGNLSGRTLVEVRDRDVTNVVVSLLPGANITGRIVIERAAPASPDPAMATLRVVLRSDPLIAGTNVNGVSPQPDGSFTITGVPASGDYRVLVAPILTGATPPESSPPGIPPALRNLYVKSIRMGDLDVLNDRLHLESLPREPMVIVIGSNPGTLQGRVMNDRQQPAAGATVVLIHDDGLRYRVNEKTMLSDPSGQFEFQNVAPGNYKVFAWERVETGAWQDPDFMRPFESRGVPVRVDEGGRVSAQVTVQN